MKNQITPLVSVIIPVYNVEKYLERCLESVRNQTYKNIEIIAVDDGSNDNSLKILSNISRQDERLKVISKINEGVSVARNVGIDHAKGDYVLFVDSDDAIELDMIEELLKANNNSNCDIICCGIKIKDEQLRPTGRFKVRKTGDFTGGDDALKLFFTGQLYRSVIYDKLIKRSLIENHKCRFPVGLMLGQDVAFTIQVLYYAAQIKTIDLDLYNYIRNDDSVTRNMSLKHIQAVNKLNSYVRSFLTEKNILLQIKNEFDMFCAGKWGYSLKMVIKNNPSKANYVNFKNNIPQEYWKKITKKYRVFWWLGLHFPKLPGIFVKKP